MTDSNRDDDNGWLADKTFKVGGVIAEVMRFDSYRPRYSMRVGRPRKDHVVSWFSYAPEHERTNFEDICEAVAQAEKHILDETERRLKSIADELQVQRERAAEKRKHHEQNVEKRREENRQRTAKAKSGGR